MRNYLRGVLSCVEYVYSTDAHAVHPGKVLIYAVTGDVTVHPVPPHPGAGALRGRHEAGPQGVGLGGCMN